MKEDRRDFDNPVGATGRRAGIYSITRPGGAAGQGQMGNVE